MANCPYCSKYFNSKQKAMDHISRFHSHELEHAGMDAAQVLYFSTHGTLHGKCMCGCGKDTEWNYATGKPFKVSNDPSCRERLRTMALKNHTSKYGVPTLLNDMEHQREMQHHRPTASKYKFADGGEVDFLSKPEEAFLRFCDTIMDIPSNGIQVSPETFTYWDPKDQRERHYDPDFYLPDYNLLVEIKDGGEHTNTNPAFIKETKYKVPLKDDVMRKQTKYNFIKIVDNNFGPFVETLYNIVHRKKDTKARKNIVVITESACTDLDEEMDFVSITENFNKLNVVYASVAGMPIAFGISESANFERIYVYDYTKNSLYETTCMDPIFLNAMIDTYRYIGESANMNAFMKQYISMALTESYQSSALDPLAVMAEHGIWFTKLNGISNNNEKRMSFVHLKHEE